MENIIKTAKGILELGLIESTGEGWYSVDGEQVKIKKNKGRTTWSCSCSNCSRFCNDQNICSRKIAVILFEAQNYRLKKLIRVNMKTAKQHKEFDMKMDPDIMICLLNDLKRFI